MNRFITLAVSALSLAAATPAMADMQPAETTPNSIYFRADAGLTSPTKNHVSIDSTRVQKKDLDLKKAMLLGAGLGYRFDEHFRADVTLSFIPGSKFSARQEAGLKSEFGKVRTIATMANVYYDITTIGAFTPYVTAGAGVAQNKIAKTTLTNTNDNSVETYGSKSKWNAAWQVGAGSAMYLGQGFSLDAGYRYMDAGKFTSAVSSNATDKNDVIKGHVKDHMFLIGIRKEF